MLQALVLLTVLAVPQPAADGKPSETPEQLAVGAIREIISAEAVHEKTSPEVGYACSLERLVEVQLLLDTWLAGQRVAGYTFKVWCATKGTPQTTYRASGVPVTKTKGASLTVCADETNRPRTIDGDEAACFARGTVLE